MPAFTYKALDHDGRFVSGELEADGPAEIKRKLEQMGYVALETQLRKRVPGTEQKFWSFRRTLGQRELTILLRELALVLRAGLPLIDAIELLAGEQGGAQASVMKDIGRAIGSGASFHEALSRHPQLFGGELVAVVRVAEASGSLETVLESLAEDRVRNEQLMDKVSSSLRYPAILLLASIGVLVFLLVAVIPQFTSVVRDFGGAKDGLAHFILAASDFTVQHGYALGLAATGLLLAGLLAWRSASGRALILKQIVRLPGLRGLIELRRTILFCSNLSTLLSNGVNLTESLRVLADIPGTAGAGFSEVVASVRRGGRLAEALARVGYLPPLAVRMLGVGEEVGALDTVSRRTADFYDAKLSQKLDKLAGIIGPVAVVVIASVIGLLVVTILSALLSINQLVL